MQPLPNSISSRLVLSFYFAFFAFTLLDQKAAANAASLSVSPSAISNMYSGTITLQIGGVNTGENVLVQKFVDVNTNNVVDAGDWILQQFTLVDGEATAIAGVTNINVPGDSNPSAGAITARVNISPTDFMQRLSGRYLYRVSSPSSQFTAVTVPFVVTNAGYAQSFTGTVRCSATNVPNALVLVAPGSFQNGGPSWGVLADNSGKYTVKLPAGTYSLAAFMPGYVSDLSTAAMQSLGAGATVTANLTLAPPTRRISARVVDAENTSMGLPSVLATFESDTGLIGIGLTDVNGNLNGAATAGGWRVNVNDPDLLLHGYVNHQTSVSANTTSGDVTGLLVPFPRSKALVYGNVRDDQNQPLAGIEVSAEDGTGTYETGASTVADGSYTLGVVAGHWNLDLRVTKPGSPSYVFAAGNTADLANGEAIVRNFTAKAAPYKVSGYVKNTANQPVGNVEMYASANFNGISYQQSGQTDDTGYYELSVPAGTWTIGVSCYGGDNSLSSQGYQCANEQSTTVSSANRTVNFTVASAPSSITGNVKDASNNPVPNVDVYAYMPGGNQNASGRTDSTGHYELHVGNGTWSVGVSCTGDGHGLSDLGYVCVNDKSVSVDNSAGVANFTTIPAPYQLNGYVYNNAQQGIPNVNVYAYATLNGLQFNVSAKTDSTGRFTFKLGAGGWHVGVNCGDLTALNYQCVSDYTLNIPGPGTITFTALPAASLQITTTFLPDAVANSFYSQTLQATGGNQPYTWYLPNGDTSLPPGLSLSSNGTLSGSPTAGGTYNFMVAVYVQSPYESATQNLSLTVSGAPLQIATTMLPNGSAGNAYTAQLSATGGHPPYQWSLAPGSAALPSGLSLSADGLIAGTPGTSGTFYFYARLTDSANGSVDQLVSLSINAPPLNITSLTLPNAEVGKYYSAQLSASGGKSPYMWSLALGSAALPSGITLTSDGTLTGTPSTGGNFPFIVSVSDMLQNSTTHAMQLDVVTALTLGNPTRISASQFSFMVNGVAGLNYTAEMSSDLVNWNSLFTTNATMGSFPMQFNDATNPASFYRVIVRP